MAGPFGAVKEQASGLYAQQMAAYGLWHWRLIPLLEEKAAALSAILLLPIFLLRITGEPLNGAMEIPAELPEEAVPAFAAFYNYYYKRARHPRAVNFVSSWTATMPVAFWNFPLTTNIKEVSPRPILMVAGENAHSRYYSEDAYKAASKPKELLIIPEADHVSLYDDMEKILFDKLNQFFKENLK